MACQSYPGDGTFMMATDGVRVYSKDFNQIKGILFSNTPIYSLFVPDPAAPLNYYLFVADNHDDINYIHIDHSAPNKIGVVDKGNEVLRTNADHHFTAVKRLYGDGYWLITHTKGSREYLVYAITKDGVSKQGVKSITGLGTSAGKSWIYGNMVSDKTGEKILHSRSISGSTCVVELLNFDKRCGTIEVSQTLSFSGGGQCVQGAFTLDDKYVYVSATAIHRFDLSDTSSILKGTYITGTNSASPKIALAPDGILYLSRALNGNVTSKVAVVEKASSANPEYYFDKVDLNPIGDYRYVENFPPFIMDWTEPLNDPGFDMPQAQAAKLCLDSETQFTVTGNFQFDSVRWDFGDGASSNQINTTHQYAAAGDYEVNFTWYLCGYPYKKGNTLTVNQKPDIKLGNDTTLCFGTEIGIFGPANMDVYSWNTGSQKQDILVDSKGQYILNAKKGECINSDTIEIDYRPDVFVELGQGYFLCPDDSDIVKIDAGKGFEHYRWTPTGDTTQWIEVMKEGDYFVVVKDFHGCPGDDGTFVERRCPVYLEIPNAFSPNGDGINDQLSFPYTDLRSFHLQIYNRWGQLVFESKDAAQFWDGTHHGVQVPEGVYMLLLNYSGYENGQLKKFVRRESLHVIR